MADGEVLGNLLVNSHYFIITGEEIAQLQNKYTAYEFKTCFLIYLELRLFSHLCQLVLNKNKRGFVIKVFANRKQIRKGTKLWSLKASCSATRQMVSKRNKK